MEIEYRNKFKEFFKSILMKGSLRERCEAVRIDLAEFERRRAAYAVDPDPEKRSFFDEECLLYNLNPHRTNMDELDAARRKANK